MWRYLVAALAVTSSLSNDGFARTYTSAEFGCSLDVPDDWEQIPNATLQDAMKEVLKVDNKATYDAAFQPAGSTNTIGYPRIVVAAVPYARLGLRRTPSKDEMRQLAASVTGMSAGELQEKGDDFLTDDAHEFVGTGKVVTDLDNNRVSWSMEMEKEGVPIVVDSLSVFGARSWVIVGMASRRDKSEDVKEIWRKSVESFRFAPAFAYQPPLVVSRPSGRSVDEPLSQKLIVKVIAVVITGLVIVVFQALGSFVRPKQDGKSPSRARAIGLFLSKRFPKSQFQAEPKKSPPQERSKPSHAKAVCGGCGGRFKAALEAIGKSTKCPKCGASIVVSEA